MPTSNKKATNPTGFDLEAVEPEHRDQVASMIPEPWKADRYIHRSFGSTLDFDAFDLAREKRHNVMAVGPSGAGKTTAAVAYAAHHQIPYAGVEFQGGFDFGTAVGTTRAGEDGLPRFKYGEISLVTRYGGVLDLSEVNFAPPRFTAAFHGVLDHRQSLYIQEIGLRIPKHPACLIMSSYNEGYRGVVELNEAFLNRFAYPLAWGYDPNVEEALIGTYSPRLLDMVRKLRAEDEINTDIGTNAMEEFLITASDPRAGVEFASYCFVNRFRGLERPIVERVVEANRYHIAAELGELEVEDDELTADQAL